MRLTAVKCTHDILDASVATKMRYNTVLRMTTRYTEKITIGASVTESLRFTSQSSGGLGVLNKNAQMWKPENPDALRDEM